MAEPQKAKRSTLTRGWFAITYWSLVAVGVVAVVLALTSGSAQQGSITGAIVFSGVVVLTVMRFVVAKRRQNGS